MYMAPETFRGDPYNQSVDVFSFGERLTCFCFGWVMKHAVHFPCTHRPLPFLWVSGCAVTWAPLLTHLEVQPTAAGFQAVYALLGVCHAKEHYPFEKWAIVWDHAFCGDLVQPRLHVTYRLAAYMTAATNRHMMSIQLLPKAPSCMASSSDMQSNTCTPIMASFATLACT